MKIVFDEAKLKECLNNPAKTDIIGSNYYYQKTTYASGMTTNHCSKPKK